MDERNLLTVALYAQWENSQQINESGCLGWEIKIAIWVLWINWSLTIGWWFSDCSLLKLKLMQVARWVCRIDSCCSRDWKSWGSGANPLGPTKHHSVAKRLCTWLCKLSSMARVPPSHGGSWKFDSFSLHHNQGYMGSIPITVTKCFYSSLLLSIVAVLGILIPAGEVRIL